MRRRAFLGLIAGAAPAALIVPELIIPKRTFFGPPAGGWPVDVKMSWCVNAANPPVTAAEILADMERLYKQLLDQPISFEGGIWGPVTSFAIFDRENHLVFSSSLNADSRKDSA